MFGSARLQTLVWASDMARARAFYSDVLGLTLKGESFGASVYEVAGQELRVSPVPSTEPSAHTVLGFAVDAVTPERVPTFSHDAQGVWFEKGSALQPPHHDGVRV